MIPTSPPGVGNLSLLSVCPQWCSLDVSRHEITWRAVSRLAFLAQPCLEAPRAPLWRSCRPLSCVPSVISGWSAVWVDPVLFISSPGKGRGGCRCSVAAVRRAAGSTCTPERGLLFQSSCGDCRSGIAVLGDKLMSDLLRNC